MLMSEKMNECMAGLRVAEIWQRMRWTSIGELPHLMKRMEIVGENALWVKMGK